MKQGCEIAKGPGHLALTLLTRTRGSGLVILPFSFAPPRARPQPRSYLFGGLTCMSILPSRPSLTRVDPPPGPRTVLVPPGGTFIRLRLPAIFTSLARDSIFWNRSYFLSRSSTTFRGFALPYFAVTYLPLVAERNFPLRLLPPEPFDFAKKSPPIPGLKRAGWL